jgi:RNA-directed DNA polymerase
LKSSAAVLLSALARSLLAGEPLADSAYTRAAQTLGRSWRWLRPLARRYVAAFSGSTRPRHRDVIQFLRNDAGLQQACAKYRDEIIIAQWLTEPQRMQPVPAAQRWNLPIIETVVDLADWLCLYPAELEWFADLKGLNNKLHHPKLQHYSYRVLRKRSGGARLIETPKSNLKALQRRILSGILDRIPIHPAVHGFVKGRSIATLASPHIGRHVLLRLDLQNFFPAFPAARVQALFRTLGYPEQVASRLAGICSNAVPREVWSERPPDIGVNQWHETKAMYMRCHLPQGAPTSPALANLMAYHLDCRLSGLAKTAGAVYTRYADDLAFSGGETFSRAAERFATHTAAIALEEGFGVNHHKTRIDRQGARQQLAGIVVNKKLSIRRDDLKRIEAILTNCVRLGPESQNREALPDFRAHLQGRVGFVETIDPIKGQRLRAIFERINWEQTRPNRGQPAKA